MMLRIVTRKYESKLTHFLMKINDKLLICCVWDELRELHHFVVFKERNQHPRYVFLKVRPDAIVPNHISVGKYTTGGTHL